MITIELKQKLQGAAGPFDLDIKMNIGRGELVSLYGASGAGKTSVLRMLAGVFKPHDGFIEVDGTSWFDKRKGISRKPQERSVGIVFQDYALFPNMNVIENISYGLPPNSEDVADEVISLMELSELRKTMPSMLSGGQRQRVALARAIVRRPTLLLLDEPLAALDTSLRLRMQEYILAAHRQYNLTTILVSHDMLEVLKLSDRVFLLENGIIKASGRPAEVLPLNVLREMQKNLANLLSGTPKNNPGSDGN